MTPKFFEFINNETKNIELSMLSLDRDITILNKLYFGTIESVPTMNWKEIRSLVVVYMLSKLRE